ncbi:MAG: FAD-dependent oxidoreductase [Candidatus Colwellbacteria bacterium]|nr:FAD-dependent oxidoreductase [Candidatus Colwellbacteria bacterium]
MYELIIIGGGPGGVAAGIYAARKKIKTLLVTDLFGGQSEVSNDIQNWIGTKLVTGFDFAKMLEEHLRAQEGIEIIDSDKVNKIEKATGGFRVSTESGKNFETKYLLVTSGSHHKRLEVPGGKEFDGRGVSYCATCDAPIFKDKEVAVVGGGNSGLESVVDLIPYASKIYLLHRRDTLKGDPITQEKIKAEPKVEIIYNAETQEIFGDQFVAGLKYLDKTTGQVKELKLGGIFVAIGSVPNAEFLGGLTKLNQYGEIVLDHRNQKTSCEGIWAAGDVTDTLYKQNNISAGDAIKAVLNIHDTLTGQDRESPRLAS